ncbi:MAG: response regulator [Candidatus Aenigmarchaeota archaeon]|nr:response regulator [Candidatus Aenigmarchaeota archaeon]
MQQYLKEILTAHRYQISGSFDNGKDAIEHVKKSEKKPDIILSDIQINGDINGIETVRKIRKIYDDIKVMYITGLGHEDLVKMIGDRTDFNYIEKPLNTNKLFNSIASILEV